MSKIVDSAGMKAKTTFEEMPSMLSAHRKNFRPRMIKKNSRHLAKRQLTWFRRYEDTKWFNLSEYESDETAVGEIIGWVQTQGI